MIGENIRSLCAEKKYLEAAELISECTSLLDNQYREISGLNEIKRNIDLERIKLEKHLLAETTEQLYHSVTRAVLETGEFWIRFAIRNLLLCLWQEPLHRMSKFCENYHVKLFPKFNFRFSGYPKSTTVKTFFNFL